MAIAKHREAWSDAGFSNYASIGNTSPCTGAPFDKYCSALGVELQQNPFVRGISCREAAGDDRQRRGSNQHQCGGYRDRVNCLRLKVEFRNGRSIYRQLKLASAMLARMR